MQNRKGLTLIELTVSIALLGMVVVVFLAIFSTGNKNIIKAGRNTESVLSIQEQIDEEIKEYIGDNSPTHNIEIYIPGIGKKQVDGKLVIIEQDGIKITTFVPNKPVEGEK